MASNKSTRRQPRRPSVPRPGSSASPAPKRPSVPQGSAPAAMAAADMAEQYGHVGRDLRRILIYGVLMFAFIFGARMLANTLGTNFVLDFIH